MYKIILEIEYRIVCLYEDEPLDPNHFLYLTSADVIPPVCGPSNDITQTIPLGTPVSWTEPQATDNCGSVIIQSKSHTPGAVFGPGVTQVKYVFADGSGNSVSCSFDINVIVETPGRLYCSCSVIYYSIYCLERLNKIQA